MKRTLFKQETQEMLNRPIALRCENWGKCLRLYVPGWNEPSSIGDDLGSKEAAHRSDRYRELEPSPAILLDVDDAKVIESAVPVLDLYEHALLKAWYVRCYSPGKCLEAAAYLAGVSESKFERFGYDLERAHRLLLAALELPAVVRKERARALVRKALGVTT